MKKKLVEFFLVFTHNIIISKYIKKRTTEDIANAFINTVFIFRIILLNVGEAQSNDYKPSVLKAIITFRNV